MKKTLSVALLSVLTCSAMAQVKPAAKPAIKPVAKTAAPVKLNALDSASYGFGMAMASSLKNAGLKNLNYDMVVKGLRETFNGAKLMCTEQEAQEAIQKAIASASAAKFSPNIEEGKAFLEKNKAQPGIKTTASGIQYQVLTEGAGIRPAAMDTVTVHYKGTLISGKPFDSSYDHGGPATFTLNQVIPGWTEGVQLMAEGSKYKFFIPYNLAYGERGAGEDIPPYSTLIFEIELIKVARKL